MPFSGDARHLADSNRVANSRDTFYRKAAGHPMTTEVFWRDLSSGRIHRAHRIGDNVATIEADNLDDAGEHEILEQLPESVEVDQLCERCFPPGA